MDAETEAEAPANLPADPEAADMPRNREKTYNGATDEDFRAALKRLEQSILSKDVRK
jgi:hypothetical protein